MTAQAKLIDQIVTAPVYMRGDGQRGLVLQVLNGVAMFMPFNSGHEELHLLSDLVKES